MTAILKKLGPGEGAEFPMGDEPVIIGRDAACDIVFDDPAISKKHAQILLVDGEYILRDQNSHNGTFIGEERITHRVLKTGDVVGVGPHKMLFALLDDEPGSGEIALVQGDATQTSVAVASEVRRMDDQINAKIRELEDVEAKSQRSWSRFLSVAIVLAALGAILILMNMTREKMYHIGGVELDTKYAQIIRIPVPNNLNLNNIECLDPDTLAASGLLELNGLLYRKHTDAELTDNEQEYDRELTAISGKHVFLRVTPQDEGRALLRIRGANGAVYHLPVDVVKKETYKQVVIGQGGDDSAGKLRGLLQRARGSKMTNPVMAIEAVKAARAQPGIDSTIQAELDAIELTAKQNLKSRWTTIKLSLIVAYGRNIRSEKISALKELLRLLPDPEDTRHQWARIMIAPYEKQRRK